MLNLTEISNVLSILNKLYIPKHVFRNKCSEIIRRNVPYSEMEFRVLGITLNLYAVKLFIWLDFFLL